MEAAWILIEVQNKASVPPIFISSWKGFQLVFKVTVDENFTDERRSNEGLNDRMNEEEDMSEADSSLEKELDRCHIEGEFPEKDKALTDVSVEVVRESSTDGENVEFPEVNLTSVLGTERVSGDGFKVDNGEYVPQTSLKSASRSNRTERDAGSSKSVDQEIGTNMELVGPIRNGPDIDRQEDLEPLGLATTGPDDIGEEEPSNSMEITPFFVKKKKERNS